MMASSDFLLDGNTPAALDETLLLLNRVVNAAVTSIVVTDPTLPDNPIIFHNPAFERISGYSYNEINGRNCRFLQGTNTNSETVQEIRDAISQKRNCAVTILNYRKDGTPFWNDFSLSPVVDAQGAVTHFVGVQSDVTTRKDAEVERDLLLAQQQKITDTLRRAFLLTPPGTFRGIEVSTQYEAALADSQIGGDFYDVFALGENKAAFLVGDVTGKGLAAAQHTAEVKYAARVLLREYNAPAPAMERLNHFIRNAQNLDDRDEDALVGMSLAVVDNDTGEVRLTVAGMEPPLVLRADGVAEEMSVEGMVLGTGSTTAYRETQFVLEPGDILAMATDGITEARSPRRRFFGYDGFTQAAQEAAALPTLGDMGQAIIRRAKEFADGKLHDDACLMLVRRGSRS